MNKLRELRLKKGFTQPKLSVAAKVHTTTIYSIEVGNSKPRLTTRKKLANALGVKPSELE
ncbi:helix-turn-helix transcriptional regulator [Chloroflexota bacterium]